MYVSDAVFRVLTCPYRSANLTEQFYALYGKEYVIRQRLAEEWKELLALPAQEQTMERGELRDREGGKREGGRKGREEQIMERGELRDREGGKREGGRKGEGGTDHGEGGRERGREEQIMERGELRDREGGREEQIMERGEGGRRRKNRGRGEKEQL